MSTAVYIRVSSKGQKSDSQRAEIEKWLQSRDHDSGSVQWFEDRESGSTLNRKAFNKLQAAIFNGDIKTVVVWKLDRLARSMREGVNTIKDWCEKDIRIVSVTQQIDLSGAVGHLVASVLFGIAEIEKNHIRERQAAGIALAKKKGKFTGRRKGTTKKRPKRAKDLRKQGLKIPEIANVMNISVSTVNRYLKQA